MLAAALALHLRYRPLADEPAYVDTWTGTVIGTESTAPAPDSPIAARGRAPEREAIVRLRSLLRVDRADREAPWVRFAFPAPGNSYRAAPVPSGDGER